MNKEYKEFINVAVKSGELTQEDFEFVRDYFNKSQDELLKDLYDRITILSMVNSVNNYLN